MKLEEGKFYITRTGEKVGPIRLGVNGLLDWPYSSGGDRNRSWREDGTYAAELDRTHDFDLVAEYTPEDTSSRDSFNLDTKCVQDTIAEVGNNSPTFMRATEIAGRAADLVGGDRDRQHGAKKDNFERIATMWNAWLETRKDPAMPLSAFDVGILMVLMKVARTQSGALNIDDYIDAAGYAACSGEIAQLDLTEQ